MSYKQDRIKQLNDIKRDSHPIRTTVRWERSKERPPDDAEFARVQAVHPGCPRELITVSSASGAIWLKMEGRQVLLNEKRIKRTGKDPRIKVYSSGDKTSAIYDPKTGKPLVFKTGDKQSQQMEMKAVVNSQEWRSSHGIPDDVEVNFSE